MPSPPRAGSPGRCSPRPPRPWRRPRACAALQTRGTRLLIDDSAENCRAAEALGWAAIEHRDNAATIGELRRRFGFDGGGR
jgi:hypothetical protein